MDMTPRHVHTASGSGVKFLDVLIQYTCEYTFISRCDECVSPTKDCHIPNRTKLIGLHNMWWAYHVLHIRYRVKLIIQGIALQCTLCDSFWLLLASDWVLIQHYRIRSAVLTSSWNTVLTSSFPILYWKAIPSFPRKVSDFWENSGTLPTGEF